jgi:hypothetical protein
METRPSRLTERIVGALIPIDCREHVLGDLYERYESPFKYFVDVMTTVPLVTLSQIRRTFRLEVLFAEACGLYVAFGGASLIAGPGFLYDHRALFPLGIVIATMLATFVLCDAYTGRSNQVSRREWMNVLLALAVGFCARSVALALQHEWTLPAWIMLLGSCAGLPMLAMVREFFRGISQNNPAAAGNSGGPDELREISTRQYLKAWRINWLWLIAALLVAFTTPSAAPSGGRLGGWGVGSAIFVLVIVCVTAWRSMKGRIGPSSRYTSLSVSSDAYRDDLERKRNGLLFWIGGGLFALQPGAAGPTLIFVIIAFPLCLFLLRVITDSSAVQDVLEMRYWVSFVALLVLIVAWIAVRRVNLHAADAMRRELDALDSKDKD